MKRFWSMLCVFVSTLGYVVSSIVSAHYGQLYVAGAPRYNHTGKVIIFTLTNTGNLSILHSLTGQQVNVPPFTHSQFTLLSVFMFLYYKSNVRLYIMIIHMSNVFCQVLQLNSIHICVLCQLAVQLKFTWVY